MVDKKVILTVVITTIIVAAITSLVVGSITGDVIKLNKDYNGKYNVYTTSEIDAKLNKTILNKNILEVLSTRCHNIQPRTDLGGDCSKTCEAGFRISSTETAKGIAIGSFTGINYIADKSDGQNDLEWATSFGLGNLNPIPSCGRDTGVECTRIREELMQIERAYGSTTNNISIIGVDSSCICCSP